LLLNAATTASPFGYYTSCSFGSSDESASSQAGVLEDREFPSFMHIKQPLTSARDMTHVAWSLMSTAYRRNQEALLKEKLDLIGLDSVFSEG
jgi:hypothetical protein